MEVSELQRIFAENILKQSFTIELNRDLAVTSKVYSNTKNTTPPPEPNTIKFRVI